MTELNLYANLFRLLCIMNLMIADTKFDAGKKRSNETLQCCQLAGKKLVSTKKNLHTTLFIKLSTLGQKLKSSPTHFLLLPSLLQVQDLHNWFTDSY